MKKPKLPKPLTTVATNIDGMVRFMLDADRLLKSDLVVLSTPEEFKAAVLLWCRSWTQKPPASLPNDERTLAGYAGVSLERWRKVSAMAMRGWILCSDERWYHPVLAADAVAAAGKKRFNGNRSKIAAEMSARARAARADMDRLKSYELQAQLEAQHQAELQAHEETSVKLSPKQPPRRIPIEPPAAAPPMGADQRGGGGDADEATTTTRSLAPEGAAPVPIKTTKLLAEFGLNTSETFLPQWIGLLGKQARCGSEDEARKFLRWAVGVRKRDHEPASLPSHLRQLAEDWHVQQHPAPARDKP